MILMISFGIYANAQSSCAVKMNGVTIGAVTAWTADGYLWASNDTEVQVTVTIALEGGGTYTIALPPTPRGQSSTPVKVATGVYSAVKKVYNAVCQ